VATAIAVATCLPLIAQGCSVGDGSGFAVGTLDVPNCWSGQFNLNPDFFAADPSDDSVTIRVQNGGDFAHYSDGLSILVDNVHEIRGDAPYSPSLLNRPLSISLPAGVAIPGAPVIPQPDPALVHVTVYLQKSCPTQNVALYALESVTVDAAGDCNPAPSGPYVLQCNAPIGEGLSALAAGAPVVDAASDATPSSKDASMDATGTDASGLTDAAVVFGDEGGTVLPLSSPVKHSTITFTSLFDGNENESSAAQRLTQANFTLYLADPREACPGGLGPPPPCRGYLTGSFQFYFQRGRPGQPFP